MIIYINKSKLFTVDPAKRFGKEFNVDPLIWNEVWRRYKLLEYSVPELREYIYIKTGRKTNDKTINRWITRAEIYSKAKPALKMGVETVVSSFFNELEKQVIDELSKNIRFSGKKDSRNIL